MIDHASSSALRTGGVPVLSDIEASVSNVGVRLKTLRLAAGLTLREFARQSDLSPSFVSQMENGKSQPSVATLYSLSRLLNVSVDELFEAASTAPTPVSAVPSFAHATAAWRPTDNSTRISIVDPVHRPHLAMAEGVVWERLAATPEDAISFMKISYAPAATSTGGGDRIRHEGYEYGYVLSGVLELTIGTETFTLRAGESLGFDSRLPHSLRNPGSTVFEGLWLVRGRSRSA